MKDSKINLALVLANLLIDLSYLKKHSRFLQLTWILTLTWITRSLLYANWHWPFPLNLLIEMHFMFPIIARDWHRRPNRLTKTYICTHIHRKLHSSIYTLKTPAYLYIIKSCRNISHIRIINLWKYLNKLLNAWSVLCGVYAVIKHCCSFTRQQLWISKSLCKYFILVMAQRIQLQYVKRFSCHVIIT